MVLVGVQGFYLAALLVKCLFGASVHPFFRLHLPQTLAAQGLQLFSVYQCVQLPMLPPKTTPKGQYLSALLPLLPLKLLLIDTLYTLIRL